MKRHDGDAQLPYLAQIDPDGDTHSRCAPTGGTAVNRGPWRRGQLPESWLGLSNLLIRRVEVGLLSRADLHSFV